MNAPVRFSIDPDRCATGVREYTKRLQAEQQRLSLEDAPAAALAMARNEPGADQALAKVQARIVSVEFQLRHMPRAIELAEKADGDAHTAWMNDRFTLSTDDLLVGISKEQCPGLCRRGISGGCVIGGGCAGVGARCLHPVIEKDSFYLDETGRRLFPFPTHERAREIWGAVCRKLNVKGLRE